MAELQQPDPSWYEVDPAFYANGGVVFNFSELMALDDVAGCSVLIAPPGSGEEALSFANMGARVSVLGDKESSRQCRELVGAAGATVPFVEGNGGDASTMSAGQFDLLYSPWGSLDWLADRESWAAGAASALKLGGRLVIYDRHPFTNVAGAHRGLLVIAQAYDGDDDSDELLVTVGEIVNLLGEQGLATVMLEELLTSDRFVTPLDRLTSIRWDVRMRIPSAMVLAAVKIAE
ncbi:MAG TPA: class I SAM-dependent methyltransferase [Tepidiformaceae bacterium]|nr:class I SAM-dependent methyltransferase [Tepidiformaceae bacterium]